MNAKLRIAALAAFLIAGLAPQSQAYPGPLCTEMQGQSCQAHQTLSCWAPRNGQWVIAHCYCGSNGWVCTVPKGPATPIPPQG